MKVRILHNPLAPSNNAVDDIGNYYGSANYNKSFNIQCMCNIWGRSFYGEASCF